MLYVLKFLKQPLRMQKILLSVLILSAYYRWQIKTKPFKSIAHKLGEQGKENLSFDEKNLDTIRDIYRAIKMVCNRTPWESKCLVQAFVAKRLLDKKDIPATVYLGVKKDEASGMAAHAWTRCGEYFVTGQDGHSQYTVTGYFS